MFLSGLEGKLLDSLIPFHRQVTTKNKTPRVTMTPRQKEVAAVINGQMFQGEEAGCEHVYVGRNLVFSKARPERKTVYVVDNPGVGALYYFTDKQIALDLATGKITRSDAMTRFPTRITHIEGWQAKLAEGLNTIE